MPDILFPAGRMIGGDVTKLYARTEADGKTPKIGKDGQPEMSCSIGYAIPKGPEAQMQIAPGQPPAWAHTAWGKVIYETGAAAHPNLVASPAFSWKIADGDSVIPNKKGKKPCDQTGYPGHWVLWFSQGWLPKCVNSDGTVELPAGAIVAGFYIQMYGSVAGNKLVPNGTPGVYLNPIAVALVGEGDRIATDVDTTAVGFGGAPLPAGARPVSPVVPGMPTPPPTHPAAVTPNPAAPGQPFAPPVPAHVMTAAAGGQTYEAMIAAGWTDALLVQHGMMQAPAASTPPAPPAIPAPPAAVVPPTAPNMAFVAPPAGAATYTPPVVPTAPAPPAPTAPVMTAAAQGVTYEAFKAQNWTDEQLRAQGMML